MIENVDRTLNLKELEFRNRKAEFSGAITITAREELEIKWIKKEMKDILKEFRLKKNLYGLWMRPEDSPNQFAGTNLGGKLMKKKEHGNCNLGISLSPFGFPLFIG